MAGPSPYDIKIDVSHLTGLMDDIRNRLTAERYIAVMRSEFRRIPGKVKKILGEDIPQDYAVNTKLVKGAVKHDKTSVGAGGVNCTIPIVGKRLSVGGTFRASGGVRGWESLKKKYRVKATIKRTGKSQLPEEMKHQGGNPPFRNLSAKSLNKAAFTRTSKKRFPIQPVVGVSVPQMPLNKSRERIGEDIGKLLEERMEHVHQQIIGGSIK